MGVMILVQARMGSIRMPGKVLMPLAGRPMLDRVIERCRRSRRADDVGIVSTTHVQDDAIVEAATRLGVPVFRGPAEDVLGRYHAAAREWGLDAVVRVTGDCPREIRDASPVLVQVENQPSGTKVPVDVNIVPNLLHGDGNTLLLDPTYDVADRSAREQLAARAHASVRTGGARRAAVRIIEAAS